MLLFRLWIPRYPAVAPRRTGGGYRSPLSGFKKKRVELSGEIEKPEDSPKIEISRPVGPLILKAPAPKKEGTPFFPFVLSELSELKRLADLEALAAKQEAQIIQALRLREEEDLLLMLLLDG